MPIRPTEQPPRITPKPLTKEDIENLFSVLHLDSENQRERFRIMSENSQSSKAEPVRLWLTGTTDAPQVNEGGFHA